LHIVLVRKEAFGVDEKIYKTFNRRNIGEDKNVSSYRDYIKGRYKNFSLYFFKVTRKKTEKSNR